jgi:hypothetical protein
VCWCSVEVDARTTRVSGSEFGAARTSPT